jgi:hypothetical protein
MSRGRPKAKTSNDPLAEAILQINASNPEMRVDEHNKEIVDVITFCNHTDYLNLPNNGLNLWLSQRVILKCFYKGTLGNEDLKLDQEEWDWLYSIEEDEHLDEVTYERNIKEVIKKVLEKEKFHAEKAAGNDPNEGIEKAAERKSEYFSLLHLVLGRRGSKTLMASIITVYEGYKLLVINNGDPHAYYNLPSDDEIAIINVALSQQQAGRLFSQIKSRLRNSPFFKDRIAKGTASEIRLYTNSDLRKKNDGQNIEVDGSVLLLCGHSNPDSLAGYSAILILFDEIAFYDESGKVTGTYFFNRLKPSLSKFYKYNAARIVMISSPNNRMGIFYDMFRESHDDDSILSFQLPTWCTNPDIDYNNKEMTRDRTNNPEMFAIEYGAQWATGGTYGNYFEEGLIERCVRPDIGPHSRPDPSFHYYAHVDPANGGNNYSMVLVGKKRYTNNRGEKRWKIHLAGIWVWRPVPGVGLQFHEIDRDVIRICKLFRPVCVSYDDFQSVHSLQLLRSNGVNARKLQYNRGVKQKIYRHLKLLMEYQPESELFLYDGDQNSSLLLGEMHSLRFKRLARGISLIPDKNGDIKTDDVIDCLAGACSNATDGVAPALPTPTTVRMYH